MKIIQLLDIEGKTHGLGNDGEVYFISPKSGRRKYGEEPELEWRKLPISKPPRPTEGD